MNTYVLYNPLAGNGKIAEEVRVLDKVYGESVKYLDITKISNYSVFLADLGEEDQLVVAGGDGTLNRFVNDTQNVDYKAKILYYPVGTGNDFARDRNQLDATEPFDVTEVLKNTATVTVKGKNYRFINGVGYGIDGYCCQVGDELKMQGKQVNYTTVAIKGLLFHFKARNAIVEVDGKEYTFNNVWIAPTMLGRYYGGGMMPAPEQERTSGKLSLMVFYRGGRIRTLMAFPGIFKGVHIKKKKLVQILSGQKIRVKYDIPAPLQIDGETILDVEEYTAFI